MTRKEFEYSALKSEQLEVITAFVGGRKVFARVSRDWVWEKPLHATAAGMLVNSL